MHPERNHASSQHRTTGGMRGAPSRSGVHFTAIVDLHKGVVAAIRRGVHHDVHRGRGVPAILRLTRAFPSTGSHRVSRADTLCVRGCCASTILRERAVDTAAA